MSKSKVSVDDIISALPSLSEEERGKIKIACNMLGAKEGEEVGEDTTVDNCDNFMLFYSTLSEHLNEFNLRYDPRYYSTLPAPIKQNLRTGWNEIERILDKCNEKKVYKGKRLKFYRIVFKVVIDYLDERSVPISMKTISSQLPNCVSLLNQQFPGYMKSGLFHLILQWGDFGAAEDKEDLE